MEKSGSMKNNVNEAYAKWKLMADGSVEQHSLARNQLGEALYHYIVGIIKTDFKPWAYYLEDAVGESAHEILTGLDQFNPAKGSFATWVYVVVRNTCIDMLRQRGRQNEQVLLGNEVYEEPSKSERFALDRLVEKLPEEDQELISLKVEGLTDEQIGEKTGLAPQTIRNRFTKIRASLRTLGGWGTYGT